MKKNIMLATIILTSVNITIANASDKKEDSQQREKCYGVAKAEKNDCSSKDGSHSCAGHTKKDRDLNSWIYLPKGLCAKLAGGELE